MSISVLIVEDEPEFLGRFTHAVLQDPDLQLVGAVASGHAAIAMIESVRPDVVLVDLGLPDIPGVEVIRAAALRHPEADVLVITMFGDDDHVMASVEAGATGYLLKDSELGRIAAVIKEIHAGGSPISPTIARRVLLRFRQAPPTQPAPAPQESPLSSRETDILKLIAKGFSFPEVGAHLGISSHTVVTHVKRIYRKLAVHSRGEAVYEASQMGLL
jgi:DNA-binding NarL/FixJ family response regulator